MQIRNYTRANILKFETHNSPDSLLFFTKGTWDQRAGVHAWKCVHSFFPPTSQICVKCKQFDGTLAHMSARQTMPPSRHRAGLNSSRFLATGRLEGWLMLRKLFSKSGTKKYLKVLKFGSQSSQIYIYGKKNIWVIRDIIQIPSDIY